MNCHPWDFLGSTRLLWGEHKCRDRGGTLVGRSVPKNEARDRAKGMWCCDRVVSLYHVCKSAMLSCVSESHAKMSKKPSSGFLCRHIGVSFVLQAADGNHSLSHDNPLLTLILQIYPLSFFSSVRKPGQSFRDSLNRNVREQSQTAIFQLHFDKYEPHIFNQT